MKCVILSQSIKILSRTIHSLARIGEELIIEPLNTGVKLSTIDKTESAYTQFWFPTTFFYSYAFEEGEEPNDVRVKLSFKACLTIFKTSHSLDKHVASCSIQIEKDVPAIVFKINFSAGNCKTHTLFVSDTVGIKINLPTDFRNEIILSPKTLSSALKNFHSKQAELTIIVNSRKTIINNFNDKTLNSTDQNIRSELSLRAAEFTNYNIGIDTALLLVVRELKAILAFAENVSGIFKIKFDEAEKPLIFNIIEAGMYEANYVISTEAPDIPGGNCLSSAASTSSRETVSTQPRKANPTVRKISSLETDEEESLRKRICKDTYYDSITKQNLSKNNIETNRDSNTNLQNSQTSYTTSQNVHNIPNTSQGNRNSNTNDRNCSTNLPNNQNSNSNILSNRNSNITNFQNSRINTSNLENASNNNLYLQNSQNSKINTPNSRTNTPKLSQNNMNLNELVNNKNITQQSQNKSVKKKTDTGDSNVTNSGNKEIAHKSVNSVGNENDPFEEGEQRNDDFMNIDEIVNNINTDESETNIVKNKTNEEVDDPFNEGDEQMFNCTYDQMLQNNTKNSNNIDDMDVDEIYNNINEQISQKNNINKQTNDLSTFSNIIQQENKKANTLNTNSYNNEELFEEGDDVVFNNSCNEMAQAKVINKSNESYSKNISKTISKNETSSKSMVGGSKSIDYDIISNKDKSKVNETDNDDDVRASSPDISNGKLQLYDKSKKSNNNISSSFYNNDIEMMTSQDKHMTSQEDTIMNSQTPINVEKLKIVFSHCIDGENNYKKKELGKVLVYNSDED